jgi:hypothetical protein
VRTPWRALRFVRSDIAIMVISGVVTLADQNATGPDHEVNGNLKAGAGILSAQGVCP